MLHISVCKSPNLTIDGRPYATLYTADDAANDAIAQLITDIGSQSLRLGDNTRAYQLESAAAILVVSPPFEPPMALRRRRLSLAKISSIGFRSGEYGGRKKSLMPAFLSNSRTRFSYSSPDCP
jgi:hypothetical protein